MNIDDCFMSDVVLVQVLNYLERDVEVVCNGVNIMEGKKRLLYMVME